MSPLLNEQIPKYSFAGASEKQIERLRFESQVEYENGGLMCTSACTCMCVMLLSGGLNVDHPCDGGSTRRRRVRDAVGAVMQMSSAVHGIIESSPPSLKNRRITEESPMKSSKNRLMTGVWEVFRHLKLSPQKIGVALDELVVCKQGSCTSLTVATPVELQKRPLFYTPSSCFVSPGILLDCMRHSAQDESENVGCVLTCKGHSICVMRGKKGKFAVFDPMPSYLVLGLSSQQAEEEIASNIGDGWGGNEQCDATLFFRHSEI